MKGDSIEVVLAVGDKVERIHMVAAKAGESVEANRSTRGVEVTVNDRNGNAKQAATFRTDAVIATIEHPSGRK